MPKSKKSTVTPAIGEHTNGAEQKTSPPGRKEKSSAPAGMKFPIVGIGASAGGLAAFEAFFSGMPAHGDPDMAFVLVQHLDPNHKSILGDLIRRYTRMQVFEVEDGMPVRQNCAYIIPPNRDMAFLNGSLQLLEPSAPRGQRLPIDFFFRSLAQDQRERAICIVLSGTGSDGTQGVRAIKGEGGMVMVQNPASTEYDGMPRSAINTGLVDFQLPPAEMASQLIAYVTHAFGKPPRAASIPVPKTENALKKIFILLRDQTSHDFSQYKPSTINRRIERRMAVHQIETIELYVKFLQQTPAEVEALFRDLLIGVTNFFRDPEAFKVLEEQVIPKLFIDRPPSAAIRVWSTGCSTGEEAYSLAILLAERQQAMKQSIKVQVFATDIDSQAITTARAGLYPASIVADISPERLARFFEASADGSTYRIHKGIRDMLVFSEQNVIKDPPFSKIDLISCRNLLIYLDGALQKKLFPLFHYALNPNGFLFLGTSESVGEFHDLFATVERKQKLYQRKDDAFAMRQSNLVFRPPLSAVRVALSSDEVKNHFARKVPLRELTEAALLQQVAPTGALVNGHGDLLYLHGRTGMYLEPTPGESGVNNILKMAREGLKRELSTALHKAVFTQETVYYPGLRVKTNSHFSTVNLTICPLPPSADARRSDEEEGNSATSSLPLYLVILAEAPALPPGAATPNAELYGPDGQEGQVHPSASIEAASLDSAAHAIIKTLNQELRAKDDYIQASQEELETSNEELKSANEEMQSVNEELQSTNEELETSKEELQSVNEELSTVNTELQTKVLDLSQANNDMNNLLAGTGIATIFVDCQLRILRFTPFTTKIINLILSDIGRPVGHILSNLVGYSNLVADILAVLDTLVGQELEVQTLAGEWYQMRIRPYRTLDNVIEGAVLTFVEISEVVRARLALAKANDQLRLAVVLRDSFDAIAVQDLEGRILAWNPGAVRMYGFSEAEALAMNSRDRIPAGLRKEALAKLHQLSCAEVLEPYRSQRLCKDGQALEVWMTATALLNEAGQMYAIATTERARGVEMREE